MQNFLDEYLNLETNTGVREKAQLIVLPHIYVDRSISPRVNSGLD